MHLSVTLKKICDAERKQSISQHNQANLNWLVGYIAFFSTNFSSLSKDLFYIVHLSVSFSLIKLFIQFYYFISLTLESHKNILFSAGKKSHGGIEGYVLLGQEATAGGPTKGSKVLSMVSAVGQTLMLVNSSIII